MTLFTRAIVTALLSTVFAAPAIADTPEPSAKRPNFLVIVADDLGYSDIGAFGGEISTPNLDSLAARGLKLTDFHTAPTCSPTRSMLLTGLDNHEAGVGTMTEWRSPNQEGHVSTQGVLAPNTATVAEILGEGGYRTLYSGKWHLGLTPEQDPSRRGFQTSFTLLQGAHNHFGKPTKADTQGATYRQDGQPVSVLPADFYSSDFFATKLIDQIQASKSGAEGSKPFFAYLAFTAPHFPIQAPAETIAKYRGRYDAGYELLRDQRLKRQVELGLIDAKTVPHPFEMAPHWASLSPQQKALSSRRMEVYAAMVDRVDQNVGRVISALRATGELDNTVILFLADNGAEGQDLSRPGAPAFPRYAAADNSIQNLGSATSYDAIGPGWAEAATAPSWRVKAFQSEGGTRAVSILAGPGIKSGIGKTFTSVMDVVPTFLDFASVPQPQGQFAGREVKTIRGLSWRPWLSGKSDRVYPANKPVGAELFGGKALRQGDWKLIDRGDGQWRLFNLASDPGETNDLASANPERVTALRRAWDDYAQQVNVILPDPPLAILKRPTGR